MMLTAPVALPDAPATPSRAELTLGCACGRRTLFTGDERNPDPNHQAYDVGWRLSKQNLPLCPRCAVVYVKRLDRQSKRRRS